MRRLFIIMAALFTLMPALLARGGEGAKINDVYVIHFVVDGTNLAAFERAVDEGRLPTVKKVFYDQGAVFTHGLSLFPSTSTTIYQAYVTGLMPGHSGIPHLERMDRQTEEVIGYLTVSGFDKINSDLVNLRALTNPDAARIQPPSTIFELLDGYPTEVIYSSFSRGAANRYPAKAPISALWSTYVSEDVENVDVLAMKRVMKLFGGPTEKIPRYAMVGLYSPDIMGHKHGPQGKEVQEVLTQFDVFLSDFMKLLDERGIADRTYVIVSADHGMHESGELFNLNKALSDAGVRIKSPKTHKGRYDVYAASRGVASSHMYVRHEGGFEPIVDPDIPRHLRGKDGAEIDLIELLRSLAAVELIAVRAGDRKARVFDSQGSFADIACYTLDGADYCSYGTKEGDPLGYSKSPKTARLMDGKPHSSLAWRDASAGERYPDAVIGLSQIFHDGRAGDIFVTTKGRYGFRKVKMGNHGGIIEGDMRVPLMIAGPKFPKGRFGAARPTDIYPLLLEWFGLKVPEDNHDGASPFAAPGEKNSGWERLAEAEQALDRGKRVEIGPSVKSLARKEAAKRKILVDKLGALLDDMRSSSGKDAYARDHAAIVERTLAWARGALERMEDLAR